MVFFWYGAANASTDSARLSSEQSGDTSWIGKRKICGKPQWIVVSKAFTVASLCGPSLFCRPFAPATSKVNSIV